MGFSLKRALLGAVVGGAHAAGEVYDAQLKEAAANRQRELDLAKQKELQVHADELLANREARKQELLDKREADKRSIYKEIVGTQTAALKEKGIGIGSAEGQQAIAEAFISAGYPEFGDKFSDNAQKAREADDRKELKKIEMDNLMETKRLNGAMRAEARAGRIEAKDAAAENEGFNFALRLGQKVGREEEDEKGARKFNVFESGANYTAQLYKEARANGMKIDEAKTLVNNYIIAANKALSDPKYRGASPDDVLGTMVQSFGAKQGWKGYEPVTQTGTPATSASTAPSPKGSQPEQRIPGFSENIGRNPGIYDQAAGA